MPTDAKEKKRRGEKKAIYAKGGTFTRSLRICLAGLGNVGRHLVELIDERKEIIQRRYGLRLEITAVAGSSSGILAPEGLDFKLLLAVRKDNGWLAAYPLYGREDLQGVEVIRAATADVLVEATPTNLRTGEPGLTNMRTALERGMHVVALAKGGLVHDFRGLMTSAQEKGVEIKFAGATAAALPTVDVAGYCLAGVTITEIKGILNGTTNYILTRMQEGVEYAAALGEAQSLGIAEPNPVLDVEGWDSAAKIILISNAVYGTALSLDDVTVTGITEITPELVRQAATRGEVIKLVGESRLAAADSTEGVTAPKVEVKVAPQNLPVDHPLARVNGTTKAIHFETDAMGPLTVVGGRSDPRGAAAAALKDIINLRYSL